jgi:hypothetical protein
MHILFTTMFSIVCITSTIYSNVFDPMLAFFGGKPYEAIIEKDYIINHDGHIYLKNIDGNITVKTGLDKKSIAVRATKHTSVKEHLEHMHIIEEEASTTQLTLRTAYDYEHIKGTVDYVLTVPLGAHIRVSTDTGDITIKQLDGSINATTGLGNVYVEEPTNTAKVTVNQQGNITVLYPKKALDLFTHKGTIHVIESMETVCAHVDQGVIKIACKTLPSGKEINCSSEDGPLYLYLPERIQSSVSATTDLGLITSEQPISLNVMTTQLNNAYWARIKKEVDGFIGGNDATIRLCTKRGNVVLQKR